MTDLKEMIERELESFIEWPTDDKSHVTTTSAKLFAAHVAGLWANHIADARNMVPGRAYLSGPMTGLPEFNYPAFNAAADVLRSEGLDLINPAEHGLVDGWEWPDYLRHDISLLATCTQIVLLPGWSRSKGARLELHIAEQLGMRVHLYGGAEWFGPGVEMPEIEKTAEVCGE